MPDAAPTLRPMHANDAQAVLAIYAGGIATGHATFEERPPEWAEWDAGHLTACRLVAEDGGTVLGWAALSPVSGRCVYGGVAEVSVYVAPEARGRGVGRLLLARLVEDAEAVGIWTLQAGIFPENTGSVELHRKAGFREVGLREGLGKMGFGPMAGQWRNVLLLERRSVTVGRE